MLVGPAGLSESRIYKWQAVCAGMLWQGGGMVDNARSQAKGVHLHMIKVICMLATKDSSNSMW